MDADLAGEIAHIEHALRATLEDITIRTTLGASRDRTEALVHQARELAERLTQTCERLDDSDDAEGVRRMAAYLSAHLLVLERDWASEAMH